MPNKKDIKPKTLTNHSNIRNAHRVATANAKTEKSPSTPTGDGSIKKVTTNQTALTETLGTTNFAQIQKPVLRTVPSKVSLTNRILTLTESLLKVTHFRSVS